MKFTLSWLKEHLDTEASLATIVETLTRIGLEVERVENPAETLGVFRIAEILSAAPHPNADRLQVCQVSTGDGPALQVVCGAPNARAGLKTVFAPPGAYIPAKNFTLSKGVIRGVESAGMMCSPEELGLDGDSSGIFELAPDAAVGVAFAAFAGLDDPLIEINLTPNRADAASVYGVARDLAAAGLGRLKGEPGAPIPGKFPCPVGAKLDFAREDAHLAPLFALRLVRGVKNGPSPDWLQKRLKSVGLRPINALVDITNFLTFDRGRPLHVFDAGKVAGDLVVRRAKTGESLLALDGRVYALDENVVVIADDMQVESLAGVMGGEASGCDENTADVLIESALWDPNNIARTGRKLGIVSDARYRFERGVDPDFALPGLEFATELVLKMCGGEPSEIAVAGRVPAHPAGIDFPLSEVERLTGLQLDASEMVGALEKLGFSVAGQISNSDHVHVRAPSWRPDIEGKADLVEEIVRLAGLDRIASVPLDRASAVAGPVLTLLQKRMRTARRALAARGMVEAVTWSFVGKAEAEIFGGGAPELALANPIAANLSDMRPSLLPGLIAGAKANFSRGLGDVALFEVGQIFKSDEEDGQYLAAAGLRRGTAKPSGAGRHWGEKATPVDVFDAKADLLALLAALGVSAGAVQIVPGGPDFLHPGRSATLQFGPRNIAGWFGELHPKTLEAFDVTGPLVAFELLLDVLPPPKLKPTKARPKLELSDFQPVERDFAFIVDKNVKAADLIKAAQSADRSLIVNVGVFDLYEGPGVPEGKKSVALNVTLQPREKTLTDAEIEAVAAKVIAETGKKTGAILRG
ncbi:phenylalanine--tRNA ligase subunit beta [Rhodoblastus acidophilus]|uniref:Phenylalanine--tRNA ligase beta subunit n=1 Tax=Candidatus Rhodoblastus alkanivorans TaxID=2954117 RepID=A0ABS9Z0W7_9HYPH|nr:phenylalanine--tRNA ligase subunit beta [Candidatus Rhodoblastus alkanivorans]MCI4678254.1 phenylalanine--tRNA ligase subunit beta [Candidatus Rhodoblastus alkanivorans]MCI4681304.1 phenylalanine--tRNA ligase subunit beta [Candidatus Rhodoblastus alkanivorans]MDI4642351.1 phenylalanine--tRNA ligase subunit beta [Rhodoblastus acidophilus]